MNTTRNNWLPIDQYSSAWLRREAKSTAALSRASSAQRELDRREMAGERG